MMEPLIFYNEINAKQYLQQLCKHYPYDIDEQMVFTLLESTPYIQPKLIEFIKYFENICKYHICKNRYALSLPLMKLFAKMSKLSQDNQTILHAHHFAFQVSIHISNQTINQPYVHIPFQKMESIDAVELHDRVLFSLPTYDASIPLSFENNFIYRDISLDAHMFYKITIKIHQKIGLIFIRKTALPCIVALCSMFKVESQTTHLDFMIIFGYYSKQNKITYFIDKTNNLQIGLISGNHSMLHFIYLKRLIYKLYESLLLQQNDLLLHGSFIKLHSFATSILCLGITKAGKSALLTAIAKNCEKQHIPFESIFDDCGVMHLLDNEIVATSTELSAFSSIQPSLLYQCFSDTNNQIIFQENQTLYQCTPITTYEKTFHFHKIKHVFLLDPLNNKKGIETIEDLQTCLQVCKTSFNKNPQHNFFETAFSTTPNLKKDTLIETFFTQLYILNIPVYRIYTHTSSHNKHAFFNSLAQAMIKMVQSKST